MATTEWSQEAGMVGGADMSNITALVDQAEASAEAAIAAKEAIDGLYLGAQASDPSVDLNGDALTEGDWYFNTTDNVTKVWDGSVWNSIAVDLSSDASPTLGGNLDGAGYSISNVNNLTVSGTVTGDVTGDLTGAVLTADQPNITSVGTLTSLDVTGALTAGTLEGDLSYTPNGTGAIETTVQAKLRHIITPEDFGAVGDGTTDDGSALRAAITYIGSIGGGTLIGKPEKTYRTSLLLSVVDNITFYGLNIKKSSGGADDKIFFEVPADASGGKSNISFIKCKLSGTWDENPKEEGANGLITLKFCNDILVRDCDLWYSKFMGLNFNICDNVKVINSDFRYCNRDMIGVWNTPNVLVEGNTLIGNDDDIISANTAGQEADPVRDSVIIRNNIMKDTGGIAVQLAKRVIIEGNIIDRCKGGYAIKLSATNAANINKSPPQDVKIINNTITNQIDRNVALDGGTLTLNARFGIYIDGLGKSSVGLNAAPSYPDPTTGVPVEPYSYFTSQNDPVRPQFNLIISGNTITRQLPAATNYSDYGYGQMLTRWATDTFATTGFVDPQITNEALECLPLEFRGPVSNALIDSNIFFGGSVVSIRFADSNIACADNDLRNVVVSNNVLGDAITRTIDFLDYNGTYQDVFIKNNLIDSDPYFRASTRIQSSGVYTGGWSSQVGCVAIEATDVSGLKIYDNTFKNCSLPVRQGGSANQIRKRRNIIISQPIAQDYNVGNLGVGTVPDKTEEQFEIVYTDSNPTSVTYGKILEQTNSSEAGNPFSGFYHTGYILKVHAINTVSKNGVNQTIFAYLRLTTGTGHTIGVDWQPLYAEI